MGIYIAFYISTILIFALQNEPLLSAKHLTPDLRKSYSGRSRSNEIIFAIISVVFLLIIVGLRAPDMGYDLDGYLPAFDFLSSKDWIDIIEMEEYFNFEKGYIVFNKLIGWIYPNSQFFMFVCAAISLIPIGVLIYRNTKNALISWIVYLALPVFLINFSGLRQGIAIGITVVSYEFIKKRKLIPFILLVLLAGAFHSSAYIFFIAYPLYRIRLNKTIAVGAFFALPVVWLFKAPIFRIVSKLFKENAVPDNNNAVTLFLVFSIVYLFCALLGDRDREPISGLSNLFWFSCVIQAMGGMYQTVMRVGYYFMIYLIILLPEVMDDIVKDNSDGDKRSATLSIIVVLLVSVCFLAYGFYAIKTADWAECYPHSFFFS